MNFRTNAIVAAGTILLSCVAVIAPTASASALGTSKPLSAPVTIKSGTTVQPSLKMLGWLNTTSETAVSDSEFRADLAVTMRPGDAIKDVSYQYDLTKLPEAPFITASRVSDSQDSIDQVYSVVKTQTGRGTKIVYIAARGDSWATSKTEKVAPKIRVTLESGTVLYGETPMQVVSTSGDEESRRPVINVPWDNVLSGQPGSVGKNSQYAWGNVVDDATTTLPGGRFYVDALSSRRSAAAGCDITDQVTYQWVDSQNNPVTSQKQIGFKSHESGWINSFLPGSVKFEKPGYYKLLAWANARSSAGSANCSGVAMDPTKMSDAAQIGSVFWDLPDAIGPDTGATGKSTLAVDSKTSVPADGATAHRVTATVRDSSGDPLPGVTVKFSAPSGKLSADEATTNASGVASVELTSDKVGTVTVTGTVDGAPLNPTSVQAEFADIHDLPTPLVDPRVAVAVLIVAASGLWLAVLGRRRKQLTKKTRN